MSIPVSLAIAFDKAVAGLSQVAQRLPADHPDTRKDLDAYLDLPVEQAFPEPPVPEHAYITRVRNRGRIAVEDFRFDSAFEPISEEYKSRHHHEYVENRHVVGRIIRHTDGHPRPIIVYVHGLMQPGPAAEERLLLPTLVKKLDVDACHLHLPFHGRRKPANALMHGGLFWTSDLVRSFEAIRQSVSDVRSVVRYLRERFRVPVGLVGVSLGGAITMTTICVDDTIDFAVPIIAHQSITDVVTRAPILSRMNSELTERGLSAEDLRDLEKRLGLGRFHPMIPKERMMWINARHDIIIHADVVERQWEAWGRPPIRWYDGSHISIIFEVSQITKWVGEFLDELQLVPRHGVRRKRVA